MKLWYAGLLVTLLLSAQAVRAAEVRLTIVVRDARGQPLPNVLVEIYQDTPEGTPNLVLKGMTDAQGRASRTVEGGRTYIVRFHGGAPIIRDGKDDGFLAIQPMEDQNAGARSDAQQKLSGFGIKLDTADFTQRFVLAGTFADVADAFAVPMVDLADSDTAPPRPIHPGTGRELTAAQAERLVDLLPTAPAAQTGRGVGAEPPLETPGIPVRDERSQLPTVAVGVVLVALLLGVGLGVFLARVRRRPT